VAAGLEAEVAALEAEAALARCTDVF
jgi:hypothetical protein